MSLHATVYTDSGVERYDDLGTAIDTPGETWAYAVSLDKLVDSSLGVGFELATLLCLYGGRKSVRTLLIDW